MISEEWPMSPEGYTLVAPIGHGAFGVVHSGEVTVGRHRGERIAIKVINLEKFPDQNMDDIRKEMQIMRLSNHPSVVNYHTVFMNRSNLWLVMPLLEGGSLGSIISHRFPSGIKDEALIASILRSVLSALSYFHRNNQLHRDVKASNILIRGDGTVFLSDFGVASKLRTGMTANTFAGSPCWMAPEVIDNENSHGYDYKADIWSFGITALELFRGLPPYADQTPIKVIMLIISKEPPLLGRDEHVNQHFRELVNSCLNKNPRSRPTADELLRNKFFKKARDPEYLRTHMLSGLPPIEARVQVPIVEEEEARPARSDSFEWNFDDDAE